tara:strand:+ start:67 stop:603 length:537 start_codon:yes stop_codon:yes gene_type:complete
MASLMSTPPAILRAVSAISVLSLVPTVVLAQDDALADPVNEIVLTMTGNMDLAKFDGRAVFDQAMLDALPTTVLETSTVVTDGVKRFDGFLMRDLLDHVGAEGEIVTARALNDYVIDIPMADFERFDVLVATHMDGARLLPSDKGPLWIVYPRDAHTELQDIRYDYRWVWQLVELEVR